jgi:succinate dehydrogenase/fumarate reductase cytochrome b subunit
VFVWVFHRISGMVLIGLLSFQLCTGFFQASSSNSAAVTTMAALHRHAGLNCLLVFCAIYHALYGVRTIVLDLGLKRERLLFWIGTAVGSVLFVAFLVAYFTYAAK